MFPHTGKIILWLFLLGKQFCYHSIQRYRKHIQWTDGTVAYIYNVEARYSYGSAVCSILDFRPSRGNTRQQYLSPVRQERCHVPYLMDYICERRGEHTKPQPVVIIRNNNVKTNLYSFCPFGHVTHNFLSCDSQSQCWDRFVSSIAVCESPLLPMPPTLLCSNHAGRVPYPLVCDHRPDCADYSDEDFCVFLGCSGPSYQCGGKQVT